MKYLWSGLTKRRSSSGVLASSCKGKQQGGLPAETAIKNTMLV
jgi:hypothetical protein